MSLPSWERGLKYFRSVGSGGLGYVAPLVGAWIEICKKDKGNNKKQGRSPRGSVD